MIMVIMRHSIYIYIYNWHKTKKAAIKKAKEMRIKKIESLKKQLKKIKALSFE